MINKAIYDIIVENIVDGELPQGFTIPNNSELAVTAELEVADGTVDGLTLYRVGRSPLSDDAGELIAKMIHQITYGDIDGAFDTIAEFSIKNTALAAIDEIQGYILDNIDWVNPENLYNFTTECLTSADKELVKYGLVIMEIYAEPDEGMKQFMRTLALSDEFTLFVLFNIITNWDNPNREIFELAKKTHGWGRIHAVERLLPDTTEIQNWLLFEGIKNDIAGEYSANAVFKRTDIPKQLRGKLSNNKFKAVSSVMACLLSDIPLVGLSDMSNCTQLLRDFLKQAQTRRLDFEIVNMIFRIARDERFSHVRKECDKVLKSEASKCVVRNALSRGKGFDVAKYLNMYNDDVVFKLMVNDFDKNFHNCRLLVKNDDYREKVLELFRKELHTDELAEELKAEGAEKKDKKGVLWFSKKNSKKEVGQTVEEQQSEPGKEYRCHTALAMLVNELMDYPMCGADLIALSLLSPLDNNRSLALRVLNSWCSIKKCKLDELSPELAEAARSFKNNGNSEHFTGLLESLGI